MCCVTRLIPIISLWGLDFAPVIGGGAILTESVFSLHGVGQFAAESIGRLDLPPILVVTMLTAFAVVLLSALVDILYAVAGPAHPALGAGLTSDRRRIGCLVSTG